MFQMQIGGNTTASSPFVTAENVVYFRGTGTDDALWRINGDGSGQAQVGSNYTASTPFVTPDGWVWFQGTNNILWKVRWDGRCQTKFGNNTTADPPVVVRDWVFFRGTNNELWRMKTNGTQQVHLGGQFTASTPFVTPDGWVWFQGTNNILWKILWDGTGLSHFGNSATAARPFVMGGWVYFRGTDNELWRMKTDGSGRPEHIRGNYTLSTPFVTPEGWVWFRGTGNELWRVFADGSRQNQVDNNFTASMPVIGRMQICRGYVGEWVYFQGTDNRLWRDFQPAELVGRETIRPAYFILNLFYSPPGRIGGGDVSSVTYGDESTTGTETSITTSFKQSVSLGVSSEVPLGPVSLGVSGDYSVSRTTSDTSYLAIQKTESSALTIPGPNSNGIDHDEDFFLLLLNPIVTAEIYPRSNVLWKMGVDGETPDVWKIYVGWLKKPSLMNPLVKERLNAAGISAKDYRWILAANPFASGGATHRS